MECLKTILYAREPGLELPSRFRDKLYFEVAGTLKEALDAAENKWYKVDGFILGMRLVADKGRVHERGGEGVYTHLKYLRVVGEKPIVFFSREIRMMDGAILHGGGVIASHSTTNLVEAIRAGSDEENEVALAGGFDKYFKG